MNPAITTKALLILATAMVTRVWRPVVKCASNAATKDELILLYNRVRQAVMAEDPAAFEQLVIMGRPDSKKLIRKDLKGSKGLLEYVLPEIDAVKFHKLSRNAKEALFVVQTHQVNEKAVFLNVFRFNNNNGRWMLSEKF